MEITGKNLTATMEAYAGKVQQTQQTVSAEGHPEQAAAKGDTVSLSKEAREVTAIGQKLEAVPDVREGKVSEIKEKIDNGTYNVNGEKAASGLLKESFINQLV